jgi:hypothetical protein
MSYQLSEDTIYYSLVVNYHQTQIVNATNEINRYTNICNKIDSSSFAKSTYNMYVCIIKTFENKKSFHMNELMKLKTPCTLCEKSVDLLEITKTMHFNDEINILSGISSLSL